MASSIPQAWFQEVASRDSLGPSFMALPRWAPPCHRLLQDSWLIMKFREFPLISGPRPAESATLSSLACKAELTHEAVAPKRVSHKDALRESFDAYASSLTWLVL